MKETSDSQSLKASARSVSVKRIAAILSAMVTAIALVLGLIEDAISFGERIVITHVTIEVPVVNLEFGNLPVTQITLFPSQLLVIILIAFCIILAMMTYWSGYRMNVWISGNVMSRARNLLMEKPEQESKSPLGFLFWLLVIGIPVFTALLTQSGLPLLLGGVLGFLILLLIFTLGSAQAGKDLLSRF